MKLGGQSPSPLAEQVNGLRRKRVIHITILAVIAVAALREASFLELTLYSAHLRGIYTGESNFERVHLDAVKNQKHEDTQTRFSNNFKQDVKAWNFALHVFLETDSSSETASLPSVRWGPFR